MRRLITMLALPVLLATLFVPASAGPSMGGWSSDNVEYVGFVPFDQSTSTGATIIGKYMYLTSWKNLSIYDISTPEAPALVGYSPFGAQGEDAFMFENEQVATNGKVLLMSETLPRSVLHVYDVEDKTNPVKIASLAGAGEHTQSCILNCKYAYGSSGGIIDLRNPSKPVKSKQNWIELTELQGGAHDVEEYKPGFIIASGYTMAMAIDVRNPLKPKVLARGQNPNPAWIIHSATWPNQGRDKFLLVQGEKNAKARCTDDQGPFMTYDASKASRTKTFTPIDTYRVANGTYQDGGPPANGLGCSAHWFEVHESFDNGGLVAIGYYEHGTRFVDVASNGKMKEAGWFVPFGGSTSMANWVTKEIVYAIDYTRGIDILRYTGKP